MKHGGSGIHGVINEMTFDESAGNIGRAPVRVHMIRTVLCVIFQNKNHRLFPYRTLTQVIHKHADCQVIIGTMCEWCWATLA